MKLDDILTTYSDVAIDQLATDKMEESASLRLPRNIIQQEVASGLASLSYVGHVLAISKPPTYAFLKVLLDSQNYTHSVEGFRAKTYALAKELSTMAASGKGLTADKNYDLYRKLLAAAWRDDEQVDASEGKLLQALRNELGIWTREHLLLEYHPEVQAIWSQEKGYIEARNHLLRTGLVLSVENDFVIAEEVVLQLRRAWDMDLDDGDYRRLLDALSNDRLYQLCQDLDLIVSGSKENKIDRVVSALVPAKEALELFTSDQLSEFCSANGIKVSGSKTEKISNIMDFFDTEQDLVEEIKEEVPRPPTESEIRVMEAEDFQFVLFHLTTNQLYDVLSKSHLRVGGSKAEKIQRLFESTWSETSILGQLRGHDLYHLCASLNVKVSGIKSEKIERLIEEVKKTSVDATTRAEIQEEEGHRTAASEISSEDSPKLEDLAAVDSITPPKGLSHIQQEYPDLDKDEQTILALIMETKSLTEKDIERVSRRHGLGWFLTKAHMAEMVAKLERSGKNPLRTKSVHSINIYEWLGNQVAVKDGISKRVARDIIDAIRQGVVPDEHLEHLVVGQTEARSHLAELVDDASAGRSNFKFIRGPYGAGKSFLFAWLKEYALKKELVVSTMVIGPDQPLSDLPVFYSGLVQGLRTPEKRHGNALADILESWLLGIHRKTVMVEGIVIGDTGASEKLGKLVEQRVEEEVAELASLDPGFAPAVRAFYRACLVGDQAMATTAISWLSGSQSLSTQALKTIGVKGTLVPSQVFHRLRALLKVVEGARYQGLVLLVDEVELIRRYPHRKSREQAYETLRLLVDEAGKNGLPGSLILFTGTDAFFEDERAGLKSYEALANRVLPPMADASVKSMKQPVLELEGLSPERLKQVVARVREIHGIAYEWKPSGRFKDDDVDNLLHQWTSTSKKSVSQTPRPVLRELVQSLDILEENPSLETADLRPSISADESARSIASLLNN